MVQVGYAIIGSTGVIGTVHIHALRQLDTCRLVGVYARTQVSLRQQATALGVKPYAALRASARRVMRPQTKAGSQLDALVGPRSLEESSDKGHVVTSPYCSRRSDHGVHASAGELTEIADLHPIVVNERPKNIGILR